MKQMILSLLTIAIFVSSCKEKHSSHEDEKVINDLVNKWEENGASGNRLANAEFFTENGIRVQGGKTYRGKEAIRKLFGSPEEQNTYLNQENKIERIWFSEDFITVASTRTVSLINNTSGDTVKTSVAAINVFERQPDGSLKLAYSMKD